MIEQKQNNLPLKKILIIEDEGDICLLLNLILKEDDIELDHVKSLELAKEYLSKNSPQVVLLDNRLPDGLGVDFIGFIRQNYPAIKICMISGYSITAKDIALANGADIYLEKPFSKEQVNQAVQTLMAQTESENV